MKSITGAVICCFMVGLTWPSAAASQAPTKNSSQDAKALPDAPKPKPQDVSKDRVEKRPKFGGKTHPWWHAFRSPKFAVPAADLAGLTVLQIRRTDQCVLSNKPAWAACNLYFGNNRPLTYAVNIPLTSMVIWSSAKLKEKQKRSAAFAVMVGALFYEATGAYTANPQILPCAPQCQ